MPEKQTKLGILMLCPLRYVASMAFVMESIVAFAKRGHSVDVLVSDDADPAFQCDHPHVRTFTFRDGSVRRGLQYRELLKTAHLLARKERYDLTIGLSQMGLIVAASIRKRFGIPCVFYNDEIWFGNERHSLLGNAFGYTMKFFERRANQQVLFTVTQDPGRGRFVSEVNRISMDSLRYLPNSRAGGAQISGSTYMHERFGFPLDTKIVLWLGAVRQKEGALELAYEARNWPQDYRLVFHFHTNRPPPYMQEVIDCHGQGQVYVSRAPIPYKEVEPLVGSATIGLGIYEDLGPNIRFLGASSGKINQYLRNGIPCIVSNYEGLSWIEQSGAGICVEDASFVLETAKTIVDSYSDYQRRAVSTFDERLSFDNAFAAIAEEIETLLCGQGIPDLQAMPTMPVDPTTLSTSARTTDQRVENLNG